MTARTEAAPPPGAGSKIPEGVAGALDMWPKAYAAFIGAFDTPHMRLKIDGDFAEDARHRLYQFNEAFATLQARLLAADELREKAATVIDRYNRNVQTPHGAMVALDAALAAYDKAGGQ